MRVLQVADFSYCDEIECSSLALFLAQCPHLQRLSLRKLPVNDEQLSVIGTRGGSMLCCVVLCCVVLCCVVLCCVVLAALALTCHAHARACGGASAAASSQRLHVLA